MTLKDSQSENHHPKPYGLVVTVSDGQFLHIKLSGRNF